MKLGRLEIDSQIIGSAVGRRMLLVVIACALLPVLAFAFFSYQRVSHQLEADERTSLHRASKTASMGILERLLLAEDALRQRAQLTPEASPLPERTASPMLRALHRLEPGDARIAALSEREQEHLGRGRAVLVVEGGGESEVRLLLAIAREPGRADSELVAAEIEPDYLFTGLLSGVEFSWVWDDRGVLLFRSGPDGNVEPEEADILSGDWVLFLRPTFAADSWTVRVARPTEAVYRPLHEFEAVFPWIAAISLLTAFGLSVQQIRRTLIPIVALTDGAERIAQQNYDARVEVFSRDEFGRLSEAFNTMAETTGRQIEILSTINRIGATLSAERENGPVIDAVLRGSMHVTEAEAGALFLIEEDELQLVRLRVGPAIDAHDDSAEEALPREAIARCLSDGAALRVHEVDDEERPLWRAFDTALGLPVTSYLAVPMRDEKHEAVGALLLLRTIARPFSEQEAALAGSLASQASVAIRKNQLVESFRGLFEGLIQLTVSAIDEKSPYTGDHCRNVPILTELIADAACADRYGPMKGFHLSEEERYELRIAALLHDCGKVVTPVHVMDKATKLETIFDRIDLVETRFEVLRRDAMLRVLSRRLIEAGLEIEPKPAAELEAELERLDDELCLLQNCNFGGEDMDESIRDRVRAIAARHRWSTRSREIRGVLEDDEVENLVVRRGTLNDAERRVIEHHVVATIKLLEQLPFPRGMRGVPAIAGAHHERINGGGYPLHLRGEQLNTQARILGLADVFEALTARDRPYKPGRTLRETLDILEEMAEQDHIDRRLYDLFVRDKVHLRYAAEHLSPEQIDPEFHEELEQLTGP
jgi:HD-GYP domain-containing protein (c-di-GMP phosphodiesterase class II)